MHSRYGEQLTWNLFLVVSFRPKYARKPFFFVPEKGLLAFFPLDCTLVFRDIMPWNQCRLVFAVLTGLIPSENAPTLRGMDDVELVWNFFLQFHFGPKILENQSFCARKGGPFDLS